MMFSPELLEGLWNGEKSICLFILEGRFYWVLDYKYNFTLDAEKDYAAYLRRGDITKEQYVQACREFRGGTLRLTADNFLQYVSWLEDGVLLSEDFDRIFDVEGCDVRALFKKIEDYYVSGEGLDSEAYYFAGQVAARLPMFYVNFDRKIYLHMDAGRSHEDLVYPDWRAECLDFSFLIPDAERYWVKFGDFWKFRFVQ
ncbi:hypothetical protein [Pseudomonas sp. CAM1A]|uniref:hypothetical protein n=1 Tax=Pseudomonas sp. CAM1A TaxID=3231717 RepID=UPI0039C62A9D